MRSRRCKFERLELRRLLASDWNNPLIATDVNADLRTTPVDALLVINALNQHSLLTANDLQDLNTDMFLDTNGDQVVTPLDALSVINFLNRGGTSSIALGQSVQDTSEPSERLLEAMAMREAEGESLEPIAFQPAAITITAATVAAVVHRGDLLIHGTDGNDRLSLSRLADGAVRIVAGTNTTVNNQAEVTLTGLRDDLRIWLGGGDDFIELNNLSVPDDLIIRQEVGSLDLRSAVNLQVGDDFRVDVKRGALNVNLAQTAIADDFSLQTGLGLMNLQLTELVVGDDFSIEQNGAEPQGVVGTNLIVLGPTVAVGDNFNISATAGTDLQLRQTTVGRDLTISTGQFNDVVLLNQVTVGDDLTISVGDGNDGTATVAGVDLEAVSVRDRLEIDTGAGDDSVFILDLLQADDVEVRLGAGANLFGIENLNVRDDLLISAAGDAAQILGLMGLVVGDDLRIDTQGGNDEIYIADSQIQDELDFEVRAGNDVVILENVAGDELLVKLADGDDRLGLIGTPLTGFRVVKLSPGSGNDAISDNVITITTTASGEPGQFLQNLLAGFESSAIANLAELRDKIIDELIGLGFSNLNTDTDGDSLTDREERRTYNTNPNAFDTDGDLLSDGFEAKSTNLNPLVVDDIFADPDADALDNINEQRYRTKPDKSDTDGDGTPDGAETQQGSDPNDAADQGKAPDASEIIKLKLVVGDHSGSHSERYDLRVGPILHQATEFGVVSTQEYTFRRGASYPIQIIHRGSNLDEPDFDYTALIQAADGTSVQFVIRDDAGIMGVHNESDPFFAAGKSATLIIPKVTVTTDKDKYAFTTAPAMPTIQAQVAIQGLESDPTASTSFTWKTEVSYDASNDTHGPARTFDSAFTETIVGANYSPTFPELLAGELTFTVTATVEGIEVKGQKKVKIVPTNPTESEIQAYINDPTLQRIARQESAMRQFNGEQPLWSADNLGGVGLFQITNPAPTDAQVWNWKANVDAGRAKFNSARASATNFPNRMSRSVDLAAAINQLNQNRVAQGLVPLTVSVPAFTEEQILNDAIRGYNGYAGTDFFGFELHEYRIAVDSQGLPLVTITNATTGAAEAVWERVPASARPANVGDPDYVNHVLSRNP